ncbi:MAG TPA: thymidylate kinase [Verrucomicrobiae bacterium]|nr:thymidylate kinase [Verrucomicrobiae bacterium]
MRTNHPTVVSFSGIDGAGKTTQIQALERHLKSFGLSSVRYTFWEQIAVLRAFREFISLSAFKGDIGVGSPGNPIQRRDKNVASWYVHLARLVFYALDALKLRLVLARFHRSRADFVIFDRYIYDELANLPLHRGSVKLYARLLLRVAPKPHVAYLLDTDPIAACQRKPEYPLEFVKKNREAQLAISRMVEGMKVVGSFSEQQAFACIVGSIGFSAPEATARGMQLQ